jgi:hypothetical protein
LPLLKKIENRKWRQKEMGVCSVEGCNQPLKGRIYCGRHYKQYYDYGKILDINRNQNDPNNITIINGVAWMELYDNYGEICAETTFDEIFIPEISAYKWRYMQKVGYVAKWFDENKIRKEMYLHRAIMYLSGFEISEFQVDHIDRNKLNNVLNNLRLSTPLQNAHNRKKLNTNTSGYIGVWNVEDNWYSAIITNHEREYLGRFNTKEEAAKAYNYAATIQRGEFAVLNEIIILNENGGKLESEHQISL